MYQFKELYTLDFSKVNYINEVHQIIKKELDFPDHYGMNWSAFWDCLTDMVGDPIHIELIGMEKVQNKIPRHTKIVLDMKLAKQLFWCLKIQYHIPMPLRFLRILKCLIGGEVVNDALL